MRIAKLKHKHRCHYCGDIGQPVTRFSASNRWYCIDYFSCERTQSRDKYGEELSDEFDRT